MIPIILQTTLEIPKGDLSHEWAVWIIGTLVSTIVTIFVFIKWLISLASGKVDKIVDRVEVMHNSGITELRSCKDALLKQELKIDSGLSEIKNEQRETKYAIQNLTHKIKCQE